MGELERNLRNETPTYIYSVDFILSATGGPGFWIIDERPILESSDSWIVVGQTGVSGIVKLDRMEIDLDGVTVAGDRLYYATRTRAQQFINRWKEMPL